MAEVPDRPEHGPRVIGHVGASGQRSFAAIGDTTNVAARVQAAAEPGQVLLAASTFERIDDLVRVRPLGPAMLKGREQAVVVYELLDVF